MKLSDLVADPATGQLSHSKLWTNIVNAVITFIVIDLHRQDKAGLDWILLYAAFVGSVGVASKLVSLRWGDRAAALERAEKTP